MEEGGKYNCGGIECTFWLLADGFLFVIEIEGQARSGDRKDCLYIVAVA